MKQFQIDVCSSDLIRRNCLDDGYAQEFLDTITNNKFRKGSWNPFSKGPEVNYSRRQTATLIAAVRGETDWYRWYLIEPTDQTSDRVVTDLKKTGWKII